MKRLHDIVHYVIAKADYTKLGKTKLNKILWFADREFMSKYLDTITHSEYIKMPYGPVPKKIEAILKTLQKENKIVPKEITIGNTIQKSFISIAEPNISKFTPEEISILDKYLYAITENFTATKISDISHNDDWQQTNIGDILPVESVFSKSINQNISLEDIEEAKAFFDSINSK